MQASAWLRGRDIKKSELTVKEHCQDNILARMRRINETEGEPLMHVERALVIINRAARIGEKDKKKCDEVH